MASIDLLIEDTDMDILLRNLRNRRTKALITGATVTARVLLASDLSVLVTGITMSGVSGVDGSYEGTVLNTESLVSSQNIVVEVTAVSGAVKRIFTKQMDVGRAE